MLTVSFVGALVSMPHFKEWSPLPRFDYIDCIVQIDSLDHLHGSPL